MFECRVLKHGPRYAVALGRMEGHPCRPKDAKFGIYRYVAFGLPTRAEANAIKRDLDAMPIEHRCSCGRRFESRAHWEEHVYGEHPDRRHFHLHYLHRFGEFAP